MIIIPNYEIVKILHESEHTTVIQACKISDGTLFIIKIQNIENPNIEDMARFKHELNILNELKDLDCVPHVIEMIKVENKLALVMEDIGGISLESYLKNIGKLSVHKFLPLAINIVNALAQIHEKGIIHKDINPSNIILNVNTNTIQIIDFGIASKLSHVIPELKKSNILQGTLYYMSPEHTGRINRIIDKHSDFYSLGMTFYKMLAGELPFKSEDALEVIHQHIAIMPKPLNEININIPTVLADIIQKLLAKNSEDRYKTADGLRHDLETCLRELLQTDKISNFAIAEHDNESKLTIPQKIYGRKKETETLLNLFSNVCLGSLELAIISGYAGSGKSSLIHEIYKPILLKHGGYLIQGSFDQYQKNLPHLALTRALQGLARQILAESTDVINIWKEEMLGALGINGQILIDIAEDMELIIGKQPPLIALDAKATENRFLYVMSNLLSVLATKDHPLVIFLDDMQWTDSITLKILEHWLLQNSPKYVLLILSYRTNEVSDLHVYQLFQNNIEQDIKTYHINLNPLTIEDTSLLIADALNEDIETVKPLAEACLNKTEGNPFYLNQFLQYLYNQNILYFDKKEQAWAWHIELIKQQATSENVTDLLLKRLDQISHETKHILSYAACIGKDFGLSILSSLLNTPEKQLALQIEGAISDNFLIPLSTNYYYAADIDDFDARFCFAHDKIRESAYSLLDEQEKSLVHYKIGKLMLRETSEADLDNKIMSITNQLDLGINYVTTDEMTDLISLNYKAALKAKSSLAFEQAKYYINIALDQFNQELWNENYTLALAIHTLACEIFTYLLDNKKLNKYFEIILTHAQQPLDKLRAYEVLITAKIAKSKHDEAIQIGLGYLNELDYHIPLKPQPWYMLYVFLKMQYYGRKTSKEQIDSLPKMTDQRVIAILNLLGLLGQSFFTLNPKMFFVATCDALAFMYQYGLADISPVYYFGYGTILTVKFKSFKQGYEYGKISIQILEKNNNKIFYPKAINGFALLSNHTNTSFKDILPSLNNSYQTAIEIGDLEQALMSRILNDVFQMYAGLNLEELYKQITQTINYAKQIKYTNSVQYHFIGQQMVHNLLYESECPHRFTGPLAIEDNVITKFEKSNDKFGLVTLYKSKILVAYLLKDYVAVKNYAAKIKNYADEFASLTDNALYHYFDLLSMMSLYKHASTLQKLKYRKEIRKGIRILKKWSEACPANYATHYYCVMAKFAEINHHYLKAVDYYHQSMTHAHNNDLLMEEGITKELAGQFYNDYHQEKIGKIYLLEAYYAFKKWGAQNKLKQMMKEHPWIEKVSNKPQTLTHALSALTSTRDYHTETLDYLSVMKSSFTITQEIELSKIIERILNILLINLGAERVVLLLKSDDQLFIEGEINTKQGIVNILQSIPIEAEKTQLPLSLIQYAYRKKDFIVLDNASENKEFSRDIYITRFAPKSVLCSNITYHGKSLGILYFENNLSTGAFTPERLEFLDLISAQIAASIENAKLYRTFSHFVPKQFLQLLGKNDVVDVKLGDSIQKNITVLFTDIRDFTYLSEQQAVGNVYKLLNEYLSFMEPIITANNGFIDKFIGDAIMALFPDSIENAINAAIQMQSALRLFNKTHHLHLKTGVGISTGISMLGTLGSNVRMDGSVISDAVNTASRIEHLNKTYGTSILISDDSKKQIKDEQVFHLRFIDKLILRGRSTPSVIWEVLDSLPERAKDRRMKNISNYQDAISLYQSGNYTKAKVVFFECLRSDPKDKVISYFIKKCEAYIRKGLTQPNMM